MAIISTHPIQYNAPFFKLLSERGNILIKVFYTWSQSETGSKFDPGFGKDIQWDIPLLEGYDYCFVHNISTEPGSHHFKGINNPTLINEIKNWGANSILLYGWSFKSHLKAMRYFKGKIPVLFRGDSTMLDEQSTIKKLIRKFLLQYIYKSIDFALYAGKANKAYFLTHGVSINKLIFMPHAVDNSRFAASEKNSIDSIEIRKRFKISKDDLVFLFAGKLESKKQPDVLAKVFSEIEDKAVHLIIAGNGELEKSLQLKYSENQFIHFLDFQNQKSMPALYATCDVFILPSKGPNETWGLAVNEAMAAGKPVIVSNACGVAYDLVEMGKTGIIFEKSNAQALKKSIQFFITNKNESKIMGSAAFKKVSTYNFNEQCLAIESILKK